MTLDHDRIRALCRRAEGAQKLAALRRQTIPGLAEIQDAAETLLEGSGILPASPLTLAIFNRLAAGERVQPVVPEAWAAMYGEPQPTPKQA